MAWYGRCVSGITEQCHYVRVAALLFTLPCAPSPVKSKVYTSSLDTSTRAECCAVLNVLAECEGQNGHLMIGLSAGVW